MFRFVFEDAFGIEKRNPVQSIFMSSIAIEFHCRVVVSGRDEDGKTVGAEDAFNGVLPFLVWDGQLVAEEDDFFAGESEFGAQETAETDGVWGFAFITDFAVACAQFADFVFELRCFRA